MNHKFTHTLFLTSLVTFTGAVFQPQAVQAAMIVVDFDVNDVDGGTTEMNWNQITPNTPSLTNLIDVNGESTGVSFMQGPDSNPSTFFAFESGDPDASQIPTNSPITTAIGGNIADFQSVDYWFKGLEPGALYKIYVFSYREADPYFNRIAVETQATIPAYNVTGNAQDLYVNDELGENTRTLETYTDIVSVWTEGPNIGGIGAEFQLNASAGFDDEWAIAGIAIEKVPESSSLLALGLIGGGMILRSLVKKRK